MQTFEFLSLAAVALTLLALFGMLHNRQLELGRRIAALTRDVLNWRWIQDRVHELEVRTGVGKVVCGCKRCRDFGKPKPLPLCCSCCGHIEHAGGLCLQPLESDQTDPSGNVLFTSRCSCDDRPKLSASHESRPSARDEASPTKESGGHE